MVLQESQSAPDAMVPLLDLGAERGPSPEEQKDELILQKMNNGRDFLTHKVAQLPKSGSKLVVCQPVTSGETTAIILGTWRDTKQELQSIEKARGNFRCLPDVKTCFEETACVPWNTASLYFAEKLRGGIQFSLHGLKCHGGHDLTLLTYEQLHYACSTDSTRSSKPLEVLAEVFITSLCQVKHSELTKLPTLSRDENNALVTLDHVLCNTLTMYYKLSDVLRRCLESQAWAETGAASVIKASRDPAAALKHFHEQLEGWEQQQQQQGMIEEYYIAPVHGSLDGSNILTEGGFVWLVGLSQTHVGHVLEDVARFMCASLFLYTPLHTERHWQLALRMGFELSKVTDLSAPELVPVQKLGADRYPHMQLAWAVQHTCLSFIKCYVKGDGRPNQILIPMLKFALEFMNSFHDEGVDVAELYAADPVRYYQYHWALDASVIWGKAIAKNLGLDGDQKGEEGKSLSAMSKLKRIDLSKGIKLEMERERCMEMAEFVESKVRHAQLWIDLVFGPSAAQIPPPPPFLFLSLYICGRNVTAGTFAVSTGCAATL
jgi:hypothetical protein